MEFLMECYMGNAIGEKKDVFVRILMVEEYALE